jgi:hypothetical protein
VLLLALILGVAELLFLSFVEAKTYSIANCKLQIAN